MHIGEGGVVIPKHVIVCEGDAKDTCGHAEIVDNYDAKDWWTEDSKPQAIFIPFVHEDGTIYTGGNYEEKCVEDHLFRGVLHTTETGTFTPSTTKFFGHTSAPHFTVYQGKTFQHLPISSASRALVNLKPDPKEKQSTMDVETNRRCAIQIEIVGHAASSASLSTEQKEELKRLIAWISAQKNIPLESAQFFGEESSGQDKPTRFSPEMWNGYKGWCGHQHVPENEHWDPGMIGIGPTSEDFSTSTLYKDYGLKITHCNDNGVWGVCQAHKDEPKTVDESKPPVANAPVAEPVAKPNSNPDEQTQPQLEEDEE